MDPLSIYLIPEINQTIHSYLDMIHPVVRCLREDMIYSSFVASLNYLAAEDTTEPEELGVLASVFCQLYFEMDALVLCLGGDTDDERVHSLLIELYIRIRQMTVGVDYQTIEMSIRSLLYSINYYE